MGVKGRRVSHAVPTVSGVCTSRFSTSDLGNFPHTYYGAHINKQQMSLRVVGCQFSHHKKC